VRRSSRGQRDPLSRRQRRGGGAPQRVFDEHGGVLDLQAEI
jgi:hypothetical protein